MDNVDNLQDKSILSFPQKVISWTLYSTLYAGLLGSSAYVALRYAQNYLALNKQSSSPDSISLGQKQRLVWKIEKIVDSAQLMLISQLSIMRTSLETHFCIDGLRGTIEYLNSPVAKTLMSSELILEKKLEAWNEIKSLLLKRFITEVLVTPLVFILNIVHLSVLTREKDLFDKKGGQCKVEGQGGVLDQLKSLFLSYLSYTDDETNFTANEEPKKQRLGDESAEIFLSISSHLLESNGFTLLVEFVEESLEDLLDDIFPDRPFTFIEFCDLLKTFLVRTIQTITVAKENGLSAILTEQCPEAYEKVLLRDSSTLHLILETIDISNHADLTMLFSNLAEMYFDSRIQSTRSMFEKLLSHSDESLAFSKILPILNSEDGPNLSNFELAVQNFIPAQFFCACIYTSY